MPTRTLTVSRAGDNIFVAGLPRGFGAVHVVPALTPSDLAADDRHYVHAELHGDSGVRAELRRLSTHEVVRHASSRRPTVHLTVGGRRGG